MCGIVGFVSKDINKNILKKMLSSQQHRGPDDKGIFIDKTTGVHLGHNRLSVQDTSSHAQQPFISLCKNYTIIFNGEVYNFKEIRSELKSLGHNFISNSDTEVILYAYKEWGIKSVHKFIGMFAFVIYDKIKEKLYLLRDRAGVKPLYYYVKNNDFLFSSELKSFHEHQTFSKVINKEILPFYFQFAYIPTPHTIYKNCFKLKPAHYIEYDLKTNKYQMYKYWDIHDFYFMEKFNKDETEIIKDIEELLTTACQLRMVSDVPVGIFLSGGYDSSSVTALLQKNEQEKLSTYTIGFEDKELNEANDAKQIAELLQTNHTETYCTQKEMLSLIDELSFHYDEPFADDSALPTILVSKLAKKDVTVALSADGGDEIFFGYSKYFALKKIMELRSSKLKYFLLKLTVNCFNASSISFINTLLPKSKKQANIAMKFNKFKSMINAKTKEDMFIRASSKVEASFLDNILTDGKFKSFEKTEFREFNKLNNLNDLDQMMAIDYKTFMVDDVLCKVDRASMSVSLEGREPLLDHKLAEYMARVPTELKYKHNKGKYLLREILKKYIPTKITDKPKAGFTIPLKSWLLNELQETAIQALESNILKEDELFKKEALEEVIKNFKKGKIENPTFIWMVIIYVKWRKRWE
ncbi:MAG: Asparagine synthetase [glutamine-hydrolyzing] (EC [uncultured Sulfurovum sp.]|uniref:asparagine synthase (glutamine-hydrolyzing) n=1 Tax=uncultured Sulfurovum sp. TaxID=269237 RepID=A0A6S6TM63_9BACT|nr:MAG: Asparagine synthetase [glutamine-hydrolyzing] (EC [uncultured Sulfurovum sp.]